MKISTVAVPVGALIGLVLGMAFIPGSYGLLIGTIAGGLTGGVIGLYLAKRQASNNK